MFPQNIHRFPTVHFVNLLSSTGKLEFSRPLSRSSLRIISHIAKRPPFGERFTMVGVLRLELRTSWSQTRRTTNCAIPRRGIPARKLTFAVGFRGGLRSRSDRTPRNTMCNSSINFSIDTRQLYLKILPRSIAFNTQIRYSDFVARHAEI